MANREPLAHFTLAQARRLWHHKQGLSSPTEGGLADLLVSTGYVRALGGADVYLALRARAPGISRNAIDEAAACRDIQVIPAVRGCMYLAPRRDVPTLLRFAQSLSQRRRERDLEKVGVSISEIDAVGEAVAETLGAGPMTPHALRAALPDGVVRKLGDRGKKVGMSSTLPVALRLLEFAGRVERAHEGGRLDTERYLWRLTAQNPFEGSNTPEDSLACLTLIAERFFEHAGPASLNDLAAWSGAGKRDCKKVISLLPLCRVSIEGYSDEAWLLERDLGDLDTASPCDTVRFISIEDTHLTVHGGPGVLTAPEDRGVQVQQWGRGGRQALGEAKHIHQRPLLLGERLAGFWEFDPDVGEVVWGTFGALSASEAHKTAEEASQVARFIVEEIGHGRSFSLDTDEALRERVEAVKALG